MGNKSNYLFPVVIMNQRGEYLQSPSSAYNVFPVKSGNSCMRSHTICTHQDISGPYTTPYINYSENTIVLYTSFLLLLFFFGFLSTSYALLFSLSSHPQTHLSIFPVLLFDELPFPLCQLPNVQNHHKEH